MNYNICNSKLIFSLALIMLFYFFANLVYAQQKDIAEIDGNDWALWNEHYKTGYIIGLITGSSCVIKYVYDMTDDLISLRRAVVEKDTKDSLIDLLVSIKNSIGKLAFINTSVSQLKDGIEDFYKDYANRNIKIVDAAYISKMKITGNSPELVESQIRYLRMCADPSFVNNYPDSSNKVMKFIHLSNEQRKLLLQKGKVRKEDFLRAGWFIDDNGEITYLFKYGYYRK